MYEVASPYETQFAFSRFEAKEAADPSSKELAGGADGSATEAAMDFA